MFHPATTKENLSGLLVTGGHNKKSLPRRRLFNVEFESHYGFAAGTSAEGVVVAGGVVTCGVTGVSITGAGRVVLF